MDGSLTPAIVVVALLLVAAGLAWYAGRAAGRAEVAALRAERDRYAEQLGRHDDSDDQHRIHSELAPLRHTMTRVAEQVRDLELERHRQFGEVGQHLAQVAGQTEALRSSTATLAGALNSSGIRGTWGEAQLRRLLEHAGMLAKCDFDEQVESVSNHDVRVRPDVVVHLPGEACVVVDAKAPLTAFLKAQDDQVSSEQRQSLLRGHAQALRGHVDALAAKQYWTAFRTAPEFVVCFVPSDAVLAAALQADASLYDHAHTRKVVLASPATLLALLRAVALGWQQQSLTDNARDLLALGVELHQRLGTLGGRVSEMGRALTRAVEGYNAMVGSLESRVLVTSRKLHDLGVAPDRLESLVAVESTPRPLTAAELIDSRHSP